MCVTGTNIVLKVNETEKKKKKQGQRENTLRLSLTYVHYWAPRWH